MVVLRVVDTLNTAQHIVPAFRGNVVRPAATIADRGRVAAADSGGTALAPINAVYVFGALIGPRGALSRTDPTCGCMTFVNG